MTDDEIEAEQVKYHAPSVRVRQLSSGSWAVFDHYYKLIKIVPVDYLLGTILSAPKEVRAAPAPTRNTTRLNIELDL